MANEITADGGEDELTWIAVWRPVYRLDADGHVEEASRRARVKWMLTPEQAAIVMEWAFNDASEEVDNA